MGAADPFMSRADIAKFCRTPQRARQAAFLRQNGIRHYLDAYGWPVVLWSAVEGLPGTVEQPKTWKPNKAA